jgi:hypothetical protein
MLGKNKIETYYAIAIRFNLEQKKIIATICETDGNQVFEFIASYEKIIDNEITAKLKKVKSYGFSTSELATLSITYQQTIEKTISSILTENNMSINDIDFVCFENMEIEKNCHIDIASKVQKTFNIPIITNQELDDKSEFLKTLANSKQQVSNIIIDLKDDFDIYKINEKAHFIEKSIGYSIIEYLKMYLNIEHDKLAYMIGQGSADSAIINKASKIESLDILQKELVNLIIFSKISTEDKLKTAFEIIKNELLIKLSQIDKNHTIMLIGNTALVEELNQSIKESFTSVEFLKNQSQRQNTLLNEQMTYLSAKKYSNESNNGVKIS